jgi:ankyrin repeat protein
MLTELPNLVQINPVTNKKPCYRLETLLDNALFMSCMYDSVEILEFALLFGAKLNDPGPDGLTPLTVCISKQHYRCFRKLLDFGVDPNGSLTFRSLHAACLSDCVDMVQDLLMAAADVNMFCAFEDDQQEISAIRFVAIERNGRIQCLEALLNYGNAVSITEVADTINFLEAHEQFSASLSLLREYRRKYYSSAYVLK